ncbi:MAG TPA: HAD domain-containing protein [Gammaproteobacteria bacterium]|nr:HAD domain-containing protein [Gammaproteobacteria bacterium]
MKFDYPVIFLDIDEVLNSREYFHSRGGPMPPNALIAQHGMSLAYDLWDLCPRLLARLRNLVNETGAKIVICSTWRLGRKPADFHTLFTLRGWALAEDTIIGCTPRLPGIRGDEIAAWIEAENFDGPYVIIDDGSDMLPDQPLVQVDPRIGLSQGNCHDAKAFLVAREEQR